MAYSNNGKYGKELQKSNLAMEFLRRLRETPMVKLFTKEQLLQANKKLENGNLKSNDIHIIELALASEAQVLCTNDKDLKKDFLNEDLLPKVNRMRRAIYPHDRGRRRQEAFLANHKRRN